MLTQILNNDILKIQNQRRHNMTRSNTTYTEIRCSYMEIPHTIWKLILMGYVPDDIVKIRGNATEYQITAIKHDKSFKRQSNCGSCNNDKNRSK